ncbi:MAG: uroporphyrinogen-III synthase [Planctomycetota bacterium]|jgi:uroporphyrinogen III methyltransferase/synthase
MSSLAGKHIVITRPRIDSKKFANMLLKQRAAPVLFPTIRIEKPDIPEPVEKACLEIDLYDWIVFTSSNGVRALIDNLKSAGRDKTALKKPHICAVGSSTRKTIELLGLKVELVPAQYTGAGAARSLIASYDIEGKRILVPTSQIASSEMADALADAGAQVDVVVAYQTVQESEHTLESKKSLLNGPVDAVTFASPSAARNLADILGKADFTLLSMRIPFFSIGPTTTKTLRRLGAPPAAEAKPHTLEGIIEALEKHFEKEKNNGQDS